MRPARNDRSDVLSPGRSRDMDGGICKTVSPIQNRSSQPEQLTPTEKKFADAQDAFIHHVGQLWNANLESNYRQLVPGTVRVELSTSPEGELVETSVLSNTSNELAAQLLTDAIGPAIRFLATGKSSKITAEVTAFAAEGSDLEARHKRPVVQCQRFSGRTTLPV